MSVRLASFPRRNAHPLYTSILEHVIPAGIAGIQKPWMAMPKQTASLVTGGLLSKSSVHIPVLSATAPALLYLLHPCSRGFRQSLPE
jgi:hypothetical protein